MLQNHYKILKECFLRTDNRRVDHTEDYVELIIKIPVNRKYIYFFRTP